VTARKVSSTRRLLHARVVRRVRRSEHVATVTIGGPEIADFDVAGADQWVRLFFRRDGQTRLRLPTWSGTGALVQLLTMDSATRPWVRSYSIRASRPYELDLDIVVHGDRAPGSNFGLNACPGAEVAILDEGITYLPPQGARQLLIADDSAVPAALSILESAPRDLDAVALLEVESASDVQKVSLPEKVDLRWLYGRSSHEIPGRQALRELTALDPSFDPQYAWVAGESGLATAARRFLTRERGMPRSAVTFVGYWKDGQASAG
jgi:NADPH-dependent ferric siderophore reductase